MPSFASPKRRCASSPFHGFGDGGACIFQQKFRDFHIELIVFRDEEMETCDVCLHLFFDLRLLRKIECERQGDDEGAPLTGIADAVDTAPHLIEHALHDGKPQPCTGIGGTGVTHFL